MRLNIFQTVFLTLLAGVALMRESRIAPLDAIDANFESWLGVHAPRQATPAPLTLVQISDEDLRETPWPWSPMDYSLFLNAALPFHPPVLAIEPVLAWKTVDAQQLSLLHNQLLRAPKVLLGSDLGLPDDLSVVPPMQEMPVLRHVMGSITELQEFSLVARQPADDIRLAGTLGFENLCGPSEPVPSVVRRIPLVFRYRGQAVPSFVLQAAMLWFGVTPDEVIVRPGTRIELGKTVSIPVDTAGRMTVDFSAPLVRFAMSDLLLSAEQAQAKQKSIAPVAGLKHSLALLARTDAGAQTLRFANNRLGSPGELFAAAIATIQNRQFIRRVPAYGEWFIIADAIVLAWFCSRMRIRSTLLVCLMLLCGYMLLALGIFSGTLVALPLVLPAGLIGFVAAMRVLAGCEPENPSTPPPAAHSL